MLGAMLGATTGAITGPIMGASMGLIMEPIMGTRARAASLASGVRRSNVSHPSLYPASPLEPLDREPPHWTQATH